MFQSRGENIGIDAYRNGQEERIVFLSEHLSPHLDLLTELADTD